jgi:hypothetical protein
MQTTNCHQPPDHSVTVGDANNDAGENKAIAVVSLNLLLVQMAA